MQMESILQGFVQRKNLADITVLDGQPSRNRHRDTNEEEARRADNITAEMIGVGRECPADTSPTSCNKICQHNMDAIFVTIHKTKDKMECSDLLGISLLSIRGKVFTRILQRNCGCMSRR